MQHSLWLTAIGLFANWPIFLGMSLTIWLCKKVTVAGIFILVSIILNVFWVHGVMFLINLQIPNELTRMLCLCGAGFLGWLIGLLLRVAIPQRKC